jgi:hypothetical protein
MRSKQWYTKTSIRLNNLLKLSIGRLLRNLFLLKQDHPERRPVESKKFQICLARL